MLSNQSYEIILLFKVDLFAIAHHIETFFKYQLFLNIFEVLEISLTIKSTPSQPDFEKDLALIMNSEPK